VQRQIMTFTQASTISEEWSYIDPFQTDFIDEVKVRKLLFKIGPPIGFTPGSDRAKQLRHLRRMELRMTVKGKTEKFFERVFLRKKKFLLLLLLCLYFIVFLTGLSTMYTYPRN
jgi:hypothetical protein